MMRTLIAALLAASLTLPLGAAFVRSDTLAIGESRTATLAPGGREVRPGSHSADWGFVGQRGDEVTIDLTSDAFDTYLVLVRPDGTVYENDDAEGGTLNSRIGQRLNMDGRYALIVTSYAPGEVGQYTISISEGLPPDPNSLAEEAPEIPVRVGHSGEGVLGPGDSVTHAGRYIDTYTFAGEMGHSLVIDMASAQLDCHLTLTAPDGTETINDDLAPGNLNSRIEILLPISGSYRLRASTYAPDDKGPYTLSIADRTRRLGLGQSLTGEFETGETEAFFLLDNLPHEVGEVLAQLNGTGDLDLEILTQTEGGGAWTAIGRSAGLGTQESISAAVTGPWPHLLRIANADAESASYTVRFHGALMREPSPQLGGTFEGVLTPARTANALEFIARADGYAWASLEVKGGEARLDLEASGGLHAQGGPGADVLIPVRSGQPIWAMVSALPSADEPQQEIDYRVTVEMVRLGASLVPEVPLSGSTVSGQASHRLQVGHPEALEVALAAQSGPGDDLDLILFDSARGTEVARSTGNGRDRESLFVAGGIPDNCMVLVRSNNPSAGPSQYQLVVHTSNTQTAPALMLGQLVTGQIGPQSTSSFLWTCDVSQTGLHRFLVNTWNPEVPVRLEVFCPGQPTPLRDEGSMRSPPEIALQAEAGGRLWIRVSDPSGSAAVGFNLMGSLLAAGRLADQSDDESANLWGIFVGVADYQGSRGELPHCDDDARNLRSIFVDGGQMASDRALLLVNENATRAGIEAALREVRDRIGPNDSLLFFFSGHGGQTPAGSAEDEVDGMNEYICPHDTNGPGSDITDDEMAAWLDAIGARTTMLFLDSCNSGGFREVVADSPGRVGLFASEEDLLSYTYEPAKAGGILAHALARGFAGEADLNGDGDINAGEISDFALTLMPTIRISDTDHASRQAQHPESVRTVPYNHTLVSLPD